MTRRRWNEPTNDDRADWAAHALSAFALGPAESAPHYGEADRDLSVPGVVDMLIGDLLADLQHLADRTGLEWDALVETGRMHHDAEVEGDDFTPRKRSESEMWPE